MKISRDSIRAAVMVLLVFDAAQLLAQERPRPLGRYARGWSQAVATIDGSEFYCGNGSALMIRHADGTYSEIETGGMVLGLEVVDDHVYIAGDGGLRIVDLLAPDGPSVVGFCRMPGVAKHVEVLGGLAYVAGGEWGIQVVDVTTPTDPLELGVIDTPGWAADLDVDVVGARTIAVVADTDPGLSVLDATDPAGLELLAVVDPGYGIFAVETTGGHAYAASIFGLGMSIIDISAPAEPELVGEWSAGHGDVGMPTVGLAVMGGLALVAGKDLVIIDASDPTQPTEIAEVGLEGRGKDVAVAQDHVAVATGGTIHFFDASNPHMPIEEEVWREESRTAVSAITRTQGHVIGFGGSRLFPETGDPVTATGLDVFEVGDTNQPRLVGEGLPGHLIWDAEGADDAVFVVTGDGLFRVVDVADPTQPSQIGALPWPVTSQDPDQEGVDLDVEGNLAVVAGDLGLVIIDITEPTCPIRLGELPNPCFSVELEGDRAYVVDENGVYLVDLEVPSAPFVVDDGLHALDISATDLDVADGYGYLVEDVDGHVMLTVVDLETGGRWRETGELMLVDSDHSADGRPRNGALSVAGDRLVLALADWHNPLHIQWAIGALAIIDVSDSTAPMKVAEVVTPAETRSVMIDRGRLLVGDGHGGLAVYSNALFADGFESGDTAAWSMTLP